MEPREASKRSKVSDYEAVRTENIQRNEEFLANLGLDALTPSIPKVAPSKRGAATPSKKRKEVSVPTRRSGRVTIEKLKSEITLAKELGETTVSDKEIILADLLSKKQEATYETLTAYVSAYDVPSTRIPSIPLPLNPPTNIPESESLSWGIPMLEGLKALADEIDASSHDVSKKAYTQAMLKLSVAEQDVAKVTEGRITSVWLHPTSTKLLCAAGDKSGYLGLWDVDNPSIGKEGVFKYRPHVENICRLHSWQHEPSKLFSVSYDGTIRTLDLMHEAFVLGFEAPEELGEITFKDAWFGCDGSSVFVARSDGDVAMVDLRTATMTGGQSYAWSRVTPQRSLNSVQQHPTNPNLVITAGAGSGGFVAIYDVRRVSKSAWPSLVEFSDHSKGINCAYVSPNGQYLVSVSQDNTVRTRKLDSSNPAASMAHKSHKMSHDNHTGRWLSTFRPAFDPKRGSAFVLGSMGRPRCVEVFEVDDAEEEGPTGGVKLERLVSVTDDYLASVCSRNCFHPQLDVIAAGNSSGRVHILR